MRKGFIALCLIVSAFFSVDVLAYGAEDIVSEGFSEAVAGVASESEIAERLDGDSLEQTGESLLELLCAEQAMKTVMGELVSALPDALSLLAFVSGLVILSAACSSLCSGVAGNELVGGFSILSSAAIIAALLGSISFQLEGVRTFFDNVSALMTSMIPVTGAVWAMGGNVGCASLGTATLYAMLHVTEWLCSSAVAPVCCVMGISAVCSGLSGGAVLDGFVGGVKKVYVFFTGLIMTALVFVLGAQTTVAGAADGIAARGAKLISATVIPGVGGAVGEALRTVAGSVSYVKSVVGVGGIVLIAVITLPTLISLLLARLVFLLSSTLAFSLGCAREGKLLSELGGIYGFLVGAVAVCSVSFAIAMGIFVRCAVALE